MPDLSHLKIGDHVAMPPESRRQRGDPTPYVEHRLYQVTSKSPKQLRITNVHNASKVESVRQADGVVIGGRFREHAIEATPEIIERYQAQCAARARYNEALRGLTDLLGREQHQLKLTTAQLEHLARAWAEVKAMGETATTRT